ncbi:MAG: UbiA-like polyprenyltransferase [Planctomycetota bacterium]
MLGRVRCLLEMIRFSHTVFALPFALLAAVMAWSGDPPIAFRWRDLAGILLSMVFARSAAMAFNRLADRRLDASNPRTEKRHLPAGLLSVASVVLFTVVSSLGFVAATLLFLPNRVPIYASAPVLLFLFAYSFTKRFTWFSHFWLGTALMLAPMAAWVALRPQFAWAPLLLGSAVMLWVAGFDMIDGCQDAEFDVRMQLFSAPARFGVAGALRLAALCHSGMILLLLTVALVYDGFGWVYLAGVVLIAVLLIYEHALVRPDDLTRVNRAFFQVNAVVSIGLFVIGSLDLLI